MIGFSESARNRIREFIEEEGEEDLAVRIEVMSSSPLAPEYDMALVGPDELDPDDQLFEADGLRVAVDAESVSLLEGTEVDWVETMQGSGFRFANPNLKPIGSSDYATADRKAFEESDQNAIPFQDDVHGAPIPRILSELTSGDPSFVAAVPSQLAAKPDPPALKS